MSVYRVPVSAVADVEKTLSRYARKAARYGCALSYSVGAPYAVERPVFDVCDGRTAVRVGVQLVEVQDVSIDGDVIACGVYTLLARLEHMDGGNVVTLYNGAEMRPEWASMPARCQHCGGAHGQKKTFILSDAHGNFVQVGSTCLHDFSGLDPQLVGILHDMRAALLLEDVSARDFSARPVDPVFNTVDALAHAVRVLRLQGYVRSGEHGENRAIIRDAMRANERASAVDVARAQDMAAYIANMDDASACAAGLSDVRALVLSRYCAARHMGYVAFAPVAYARHIERENERAAARSASEYIGSVGERVTLDIASADVITTIPGQYGVTTVYKLVDVSGNVCIWFASGSLPDGAQRVKATIKGHNERDGVKQTMLTRVKAI